PADAWLDPPAALQQLRQRPTRLALHADAGQAWLLADLPVGSSTDPGTRLALLVPAHPAGAPQCWLTPSLHAGDDASSSAPLVEPEVRDGLPAQERRLPHAPTAEKA